MFKNRFLSFFVLGVIIYAVIHSPEISRAVTDSLGLCFDSVIPALFPFLVLSGILINNIDAHTLGPLTKFIRMYLGLGGASVGAFVCGLLCGYPIGAKCGVELYNSKKITSMEAENLIACANNSGPVFIICVVGMGMLKSARLGIVLYCIHVFCAINVALLLNRYGSISVSDTVCKSDGKYSMAECVASAVHNMLTICGFVVFFSVVNKLLLPIISVLPCNIGDFVLCIPEVTNGVKHLSSSDLSPEISFALISFSLGWSGMSVHMQVKSIIGSAPISMKKYYFAKCFAALESFCIAYVIYAHADTIALFLCSRKLLVFFIILIILAFPQKKKDGHKVRLSVKNY